MYKVHEFIPTYQNNGKELADHDERREERDDNGMEEETVGLTVGYGRILQDTVGHTVGNPAGYGREYCRIR